MHLGRREIERVPQARADRQPVGHLPVVLNEVLLELRAVSNLLLLQIDREVLHLAEQEARERRARCSATPGRSLQSVLNVNEPVGEGG